MENFQKKSPVCLDVPVQKMTTRNGWEIVSEYADEGDGPCLTDLSHAAKWDIQDTNLSGIRIQNQPLPEKPGQCILAKDSLLIRRTATRAAVWHFSGEDEIPLKQPWTDVTDALALLSLSGDPVFRIMENLTRLDLTDPASVLPFMLEGRMDNIPGMVVVAVREKGLVLIACPRSLGQAMAEAILRAGAQWGIRPAGENAFFRAFSGLHLIQETGSMPVMTP